MNNYDFFLPQTDPDYGAMLEWLQNRLGQLAMANSNKLIGDLIENFLGGKFEDVEFNEELLSQFLDRILHPKVAIKVVDGIFEDTLVSSPITVLQIETDVSGDEEMDTRHRMIDHGGTWFYPTSRETDLMDVEHWSSIMETLSDDYIYKEDEE